MLGIGSSDEIVVYVSVQHTVLWLCLPAQRQPVQLMVHGMKYQCIECPVL